MDKGQDCILVELEPPYVKQFTKAGTPSSRLNQAIKQIMEWDHWIKMHLDEFCMNLPKRLSRYSPSADLPIKLRSAFVTFKIVIGRRGHLTPKDQEYRSSFFHSHAGKVEIMTYDRILDKAKLTSVMY